MNISYNNQLFQIYNIQNNFLNSAATFSQNIDFNHIKNEMETIYTESFDREFDEIIKFFHDLTIDLSNGNYENFLILFDYFLFSHNEYELVVQQNYQFLLNKYFSNEINHTDKHTIDKNEYNNFILKRIDYIDKLNGKYDDSDVNTMKTILALEIYHFSMLNINLLKEDRVEKVYFLRCHISL